VTPLKFAYADPPYLGQARRHYSHDPNCAEVDHAALVARLESEFDGWALSCKSNARELSWLISLCKQPVRLGAWVKPFASFKPGVSPAYAWEPVIFYSPRPHTRTQATARDWVSANITLKRGLAGVKPKEFCFWLFEVLNLLPGDELCDLFPGSGAVTLAWEQYRAWHAGRVVNAGLFSGMSAEG
jgi:hypothetical protein